MVLYQPFIFVWIENPKWPSPGDLFYHWTLWEFHWKAFLWETTRRIEFFALYECSLDGLVPESNMAARANNVFCLAETLKIFLSERNCNIVGMMTGWSSTKFLFFVADGKSKMASIFQVSLPFFFSLPMGNPRWPPFSKLVYHLTYGNCVERSFCHRLWDKLIFLQCINHPWMILHQTLELHADGKSKIAVTAQLSLKWRTLEVLRPQTLFSIIVLRFEFFAF